METTPTAARAAAASMQKRDPELQGRLRSSGRSLLPPSCASGAFAPLSPLREFFSLFRPSLKVWLEFPAA